MCALKPLPPNAKVIHYFVVVRCKVLGYHLPEIYITLANESNMHNKDSQVMSDMFCCYPKYSHLLWITLPLQKFYAEFLHINTMKACKAGNRESFYENDMKQ